MFTKQELRTVRTIIRRIAQSRSTSEAQIRMDMESAIRHGQSNPDPAVQACWASFRYSGPEPTVEEFILWAASMAKDRIAKETME